MEAEEKLISSYSSFATIQRSSWQKKYRHLPFSIRTGYFIPCSACLFFIEKKKKSPPKTDRLKTEQKRDKYVLSRKSNPTRPRTAFPHYSSTAGGCSFEAKRPQYGLPRCLLRFPMSRGRGEERKGIKAYPEEIAKKE